MIHFSKHGLCRPHVILPVVLLASGSIGWAERPAIEEPRIPDKEIAALRKELTEAAKASSSARKRRAYKNVVRDGVGLLKGSPAAANRFRVLEIMFQSQKRLLALENSDRNREALFDTSSKLAAAPDELADLRLEADMLLSERDLSAKKADVKERTQALTDLIARYRDTPGEAKSLMLASLIAPKLEAFDLEKQIFRAMDERFAGDLDLIEWRRKTHGYAHERVLFSGTYARADGTSLRFPMDGVGHTCLMVFWSRKTPDIAEKLAPIADLQSRFPGQVEVFSFNVDELPGGGEKTLRSFGLDWTAMLLPAGRESQIYRVVARSDPIAVRVNAHGHAFLPSTLIDMLTDEMSMEQNLDDLRYLAQLQSLVVGDFLVSAAGAGASPEASREGVPAQTLEAIRSQFVLPPFRYRLTGAEALSNYTKAEASCRDAIGRFPNAPDLWRVRNLRIVALLGMWKHALEPKHLTAAVAESRLALEASLPHGADVVPRFCLARRALREVESAPHLVLSEMIAAVGGSKAPPSAYAAAAVLAFDVSAVDLHAIYRQKLLETHDDDPSLWPLVSFLLDQNHSFRLFRANYYMPPSQARRIVRARLRSNAAALGTEPGFHGPLEAEFETLSGEIWKLPQATAGKLTLLMFVEPPADPSQELPIAIQGSVRVDDRGRKHETKGAMQHAFEFAAQHTQKRLQVIAAFLSDDRARVEALMKKHQWPCQAVLVPGALRSPLVRRLGILSADRVPNIVLVRADGTIAWRLSGIVHPQLRSEGVGELLYAISRAMRTHIMAFEMQESVAAFAKSDLEEAVKLFSGPFPTPERRSFDEWTAPRLHGRALSHMGLESWEAALADLDGAIEAHQAVFNARKRCVCEYVGRLQRTKMSVLERLGRAQESEELREQLDAIRAVHGDSLAGRLHEKLESLYRERSSVKQ